MNPRSLHRKPTKAFYGKFKKGHHGFFFRSQEQKDRNLFPWFRSTWCRQIKGVAQLAPHPQQIILQQTLFRQIASSDAGACSGSPAPYQVSENCIFRLLCGGVTHRSRAPPLAKAFLYLQRPNLQVNKYGCKSDQLGRRLRSQLMRLLVVESLRPAWPFLTPISSFQA